MTMLADSAVVVTPTTAGIIVTGVIVMTLIVMVWKDPARGQVVIVYISSGIARALGRGKKPARVPERRSSKPGRRKADFLTLSIPYDELQRNEQARRSGSEDQRE